ncbi:MAG: hypothetical protein ACI9F9_003350, partial [Candidatus Paceibacteria bacterium]
ARKPALVLGLIALLAGMGWLIQQPGSTQALPQQAPLIVDRSPAKVAAPTEKLPTPIQSEEVAQLAKAQEGATREKVDARALDASEFVLKLVTSDGAPVVDATVRVLWSGSRAQRNKYRNNRKAEELMAKSFLTLTSDSDGLVPLKRAPLHHFALIDARKGNLWASLTIPGSEAPANKELTLVHDLNLTVLVIDTAGNPVGGVPVVIESSTNQWRSTIVGTTSDDRTGLAFFAHIQDELKDETYRVALNTLSAVKVMQALDLEKLSSDPLVLMLPASGSVTLEVLGTDAKRYLGSGRARIRSVAEGASQDLSPFNHGGERFVSAELESGSVHFPFVELGMNVQARVARARSNVESTAFGPGPRIAGADAAIVVRLGAQHPVIQLRAVSANGKPFANVEFKAGLTIRNEFMLSALKSWPRSDDEGRFQVDVSPSPAKGSLATLLIQLGGSEDLSGTIDVPEDLTNGLHDLGDLVIEKPRLFVGGRIAGRDGSVISNAKLALRARADDDPNSSWRTNHQFQESTDSEGRFAIYEPSPGKQFQLSTEASGFASTWVDFEVGTSDLILELATEGKVTGVVLLDEGISMELLSIMLPEDRDAGEHRAYNNFNIQPKADGSFEFDNLIAGEERSLRFSAKRHSKAIYSVENVVVLAGGVTADPRINPLDLRGKLFQHDIELVTPTGAGRLNGFIRFRAAGAESIEANLWLNESNVSLLTSTKSIDIFIEAAGYRNTELTGITGATRVELKKAIEVTLILPSDVELPKPPIHLKATLLPDTKDGQPSFNGNAFDERRIITTMVGSAGLLRVAWLMEQRSASSSMGREVVLKEKQLVEVLDMEGEQRITLKLTQEQMDQLVKQMDL